MPVFRRGLIKKAANADPPFIPPAAATIYPDYWWVDEGKPRRKKLRARGSEAFGPDFTPPAAALLVELDPGQDKAPIRRRRRAWYEPSVEPLGDMVPVLLAYIDDGHQAKTVRRRRRGNWSEAFSPDGSFPDTPIVPTIPRYLVSWID